MISGPSRTRISRPGAGPYGMRKNVDPVRIFCGWEPFQWFRPIETLVHAH
jgi:hypothetical protein